jgi:hypothetical protein
VPKDRVNFDFRIGELRKFALLSTCVATLASAAAAEMPAPSVQSILSTMNAAGGSETLQWQVGPTYSERFGLGVRGSIGGYVNEDFALGVIIDYAKHREEYLANAGVRLDESLRIIGSLGLLKESEEFAPGAGREDVRQLQYGLSLKGSYDAGIMRGYEVNAYHTSARSDTDSVEAGNLTGLQFVTHLQPSSTADLRLGAGYERANWAGGDEDTGFTVQALGSQRVSDILSLNYSAAMAETENVYGVGLTYDLSSGDVRNNMVSINLSRTAGKHGISDDTRLALNWTVGFGGGTGTTTSSMGSMSGLASRNLLAEVMTRPAFLPNRVLARGGSCAILSGFGIAKDEDPAAQKTFGDEVQLAWPTLPSAIKSLFWPPPYNWAPVPSGTIIQIFVNGSEYTGTTSFKYLSYPEVLMISPDPHDATIFSAGDNVRIVIDTGAGCFEQTIIAT